jgi:putative transposase
MARYRRFRRKGGTYFLTVALETRGTHTLPDQIGTLRAAVARTEAGWPSRMEAWVVLPDHLHAVWPLPEGDADLPTRWQLIKAPPVRDDRAGTLE